MKKLLLLAALPLAVSMPTAAQTPTTAPVTAREAPAETTLKDLLNSVAHPLTIKLSEMKPEEWRRFTLTGDKDGEIGNYLALIFGAFGGGAGLDTLPNTDAIYYTQGQTVPIGGETYLLAYRPLLKQPDMMALIALSQRNGNAQPAPEQMLPEKMTLDTSVSMSLLNVKKIGGMADIRSFDAAAEVTERQAANKTLADMLQANAAQNQPIETAAPQPVIAPKIRAALAADKTLKADGNSIAVEEGENLITLRGTVISAKVKDYAGHVARKYLKDNGIGFTVQNELTTPDANQIQPPPNPPGAKPAKRKR